jgi:ABC-2 type transport system ATP-binding protein
MNSPAIEIIGLSIKFGEFTAVNNVSFSVNKGEIFGFLGANGAGKTTTIRVLCGLLRPTAGTVYVSGLDAHTGGHGIKSIVGYMSQKFTLYDDLTVTENMSFKASLRRMEPQLAARRTQELFSFIGFTYNANTLVRNLPSGIKQQVSLAATLLHDPSIIFLDEPTSGVSPTVRANFWKLISGLADRGKTIIVTTHYMDEAEQCGRIALMRSGEIIALGSPEELKKQAFPDAEKTPSLEDVFIRMVKESTL